MLTGIRQSKGRLEKENEISTYAGRYALDTPGNGLHLPYFSDPHIRIQSSSGVRGIQGTTDWESELRGISRPLTRYDTHDYHMDPKTPTMASVTTHRAKVTEESRTIAPAWMLRECVQDRWEKPFLNPLDKCFVPFDTNMNVRQYEMDAAFGHGPQKGSAYSAGLFGPALENTQSYTFRPLLPGSAV